MKRRERTSPLPRCLRPPLLLLAMAIAVWPVHAAAAQEESSASPAPKVATTISVAFEPSSMDGIPHYLAVRLATADGSALVGERVRLRRVVDIFGGRTVTLGRATTDNAGMARVPLVPREATYKVTADFSGSDALAAAKVEDDIVFPAGTVVIPEEVPRGGLVDPQLRPLADVMPIAIGAAVIVVWIVLIGVAVVTLMRIRSTPRRDARATVKPDAELPDAGSGPQDV